MRQPQPKPRTGYSIGKADFAIFVIINISECKIRIQLTLIGVNSNAHFHLVMNDKKEIDCQLGENLEWSELPSYKKSQISLDIHNTDITDRESWQETHSWLHQKLELFDRVFRHRIMELDAADWNPEDNERVQNNR